MISKGQRRPMEGNGHSDIREAVFRRCLSARITAVLLAEKAGVLSGVERTRPLMEALGLHFEARAEDGEALEVNQEVARVIGNPIQIASAEERIIGALSKYSGIATAARTALQKANGKYSVVSGAWKKMPFELKEPIRQAIRDGGLDVRICDHPFIYLDKNYVRILGGLHQAVQISLPFKRKIVVQIKAKNGMAADEAMAAVKEGASVVMVDTGNYQDLSNVSRALRESGLRPPAQLAFAGNIRLQDLDALSQFDIDVVDVGYAIVDAPCLPMRFDVIGVA